MDEPESDSEEASSENQVTSARPSTSGPDESEDLVCLDGIQIIIDCIIAHFLTSISRE